MDTTPVARHKLLNALQTILLLGGMGLLLAWSARLIFGEGVTLHVFVWIVLLMLLAPKVSPALVLRMYGARLLDGRDAPELVAVLEELARRAGLPAVPRLYYVPSSMLNAFAVGSRDDAAIAVTDGLLRRLNLRELAGVLAHEISHVRNRDMWVMGLSDTVTRMTHILSLAGQFLILLNLPLILMAEDTISWTGLLLLVFAPQISALLQLALSRTREYDADLDAARLTGDPEGLAAALAKLEKYNRGWMEQVLLPGRRDPNPSLLRTHPPTEERIRRLLALREPATPLNALTANRDLSFGHPMVRQPPRRHRPLGLWY